MRGLRWLRSLSLVLGTGYTLFFFSEKMFWSFWRADDGVVSQAGGTVAYSVFGYLMLACVRGFRAGRVYPVFLIGALGGWLCEGVYGMTLLGAEGIPFPFTIVWTGLAWHALLSTLAGWLALGAILRDRSPARALAAAVAVGAFWGAWALGWAEETPPLRPDPFPFLTNVALATAALAAAQLAIFWGAGAFRPSRAGLLAAGGVVAAFFAAVTVPALPWSPAVLLPLVGLVLFCLRRSRAEWSGRDAIDALAARPRPLNLVALTGIPLAAGLVYCGAGVAGLQVPAHPFVAVATSAAGLVLFIAAVLRLGLGRPSPNPLHPVLPDAN